MDALSDAQRLLEMASATDLPYSKELRNIARRILLDVAETLAPMQPMQPLQPLQTTPPASPPPTHPPSLSSRQRPLFTEPPSPISRILEIDSEDDAPAPASVMTGATTARNRKNFAKFVRTLDLANDTEFFYGSVKFLLNGAGTPTPTLTFVHNGMRISSPAPSGIISQYEKLVNGRTVSANGWDRLKMLDGEDRPRSLSWEGWDMIM